MSGSNRDTPSRLTERTWLAPLAVVLPFEWNRWAEVPLAAAGPRRWRLGAFTPLPHARLQRAALPHVVMPEGGSRS